MLLCGIGADVRWLDEFMHPALKCARLGHNMVRREVPVYLYPGEGYRSVADQAVEVSERCSRCPHETETRVTKRRGLNGLSMSADRWARLEEEGRLVQ